LTSTLFFPPALACAVALATLGGCELLKHNEEAIAVINARVIGMPAGEFFDRYGRASVRDERPDGSSEYAWISDLAQTPAGQAIDDRICRLRISVDARGKVSGVVVLFDSPGRKSSSRCGEIFAN
jgi:hypothetical protein